MVVIASCKNAFEADMVKGNLESCGLHPVVFDHSSNALFPGIFSTPISAVEVSVPDEEAQEALEILNNKD